MITLLLTVIYISYIGLGLPHSLFGAAWPAIHTDLGLSIEAANYITVLISGSTVIASIFGSRLANRFGTYAVVAVGTVLASAALMGFSLSGSLLMMCLCAIPLGLSSGAIDVALNNFIAVNYSAMHINFLHCFYGVGIMASPYIMSLMLESAGWRSGYRAVFLIQLIIAAIIIFSYPVWKRSGSTPEEERKPENLSFLKMIKMPSILLIWVVCIAANAIEGVGGLWGSSFLVYSHGFSEAAAAKAITLFYIGIALGRFLSGILSVKISSWRLIIIGVVIMALGVIMMFLPYNSVIVLGIFLLGLGNGPVHPNIIHLTPRHFGEKYSASVVASEMAAAYFGITMAPPVFGMISKYISTDAFPLYTGIWLAIFVIASFYFLKKTDYLKKDVI